MSGRDDRRELRRTEWLTNEELAERLRQAPQGWVTPSTCRRPRKASRGWFARLFGRN